MTDTDSTPLAGRWVILHQVSMAGGSPIDSTRTDREGRYRLRAPRLDTTAVYLVSVSYDDIAYFGQPVRPGGPGTAETIAVYDTSTTAPPISVSQRHLIIRRPESDGSRRVLELLVLRNDGARTRISPDTSRPVWQDALPDGAVQFEVGEGDVSQQAVYIRGRAIAVAAAIPPGDKQLLVSYVLPRSVRALDLLMDQPVEQMNVLVEDSAATANAELPRVGIERVEGVPFTRFERTDIPSGTRIMVRFAREPFRVTSLWWLVVMIAALALAAALVPLVRRRAVPVPATPRDPEALGARIAALDLAFEQRDAAGSPEETETYRQQRDALKQQLEALLRD